MSDNPEQVEQVEQVESVHEETQVVPDAGARLVPVAESIKYRRRAQQAEQRIEQLQRELHDVQGQLERRHDETAAAEAQRDEAQQQLTLVHNRLQCERLMAQAGVIDMETAWLLLSKRMDAAQELDSQAVASAVEQLLLDKPFLRGAGASLPPKTASPRRQRDSAAAQLAQAAQRAAVSGDRRDVANYLRLRRQTAPNKRSY